jgi:hypothetical protein
LQLDVPSPESFGVTGNPIIGARPPVSMDVPSADVFGADGLELFLAAPSLSIEISNQQQGQTP